MHLDAS
jgi:calpain-15